MSYTDRVATASALPLSADVQRILNAVENKARRPSNTPALAVLSGLPGTGKSTLARALRDRTGALVLESDALRRLFVPRPAYSAAESERLFAAIHGAIDALLEHGRSVILDATNLTEAERAPVRAIAAERGARLVVVEVTAPSALVRQRLSSRTSTSDADVSVYERMRKRLEEIKGPHFVADTSQETEAVAAEIVEELTPA